MKMQQILFLFLFGFLSTLASAEVDYDEYARLLERYVEPDGVRYEAWVGHAGDRTALKGFLYKAAGVDVALLDEAAQKAFYINLYNAAMLQAVLANWPIDSVKEIGPEPFSIFKKEFISQDGRRLSLDKVEKEILLKKYFDPRIHFAVNCASESCPPLRGDPFIGKKLETQLDEQTRAFATSQRAARINRKKESVAYSELFKWYADDFPGEHPGAYLNRFRDRALPLDFALEWIDYDWSLNSAE